MIRSNGFLGGLHDDNSLCYELVAPADEESPVPLVLKIRRNVINHLVYRVTSLQESASAISQPSISFGCVHDQFFLSPLGHIIE